MAQRLNNEKYNLMNKETIALFLQRRLKGILKNIIDLCGKPLFVYY